MGFLDSFTITVGFLSQIVCVTYYFVFMFESLQHKNTEKQASELKVDSRDQPIVVSEVGL